MLGRAERLGGVGGVGGVGAISGPPRLLEGERHDKAPRRARGHPGHVHPVPDSRRHTRGRGRYDDSTGPNELCRQRNKPLVSTGTSHNGSVESAPHDARYPLGRFAHNLHAREPERSTDRLQKRHPGLSALDQRYSKVRADDLQGVTRKSGPATDVYEASKRGQHAEEQQTIQEKVLDNPCWIRRADQTMELLPFYQ